MENKVSYERYLELCEELGYDPSLPEFFSYIVDRNMYKPSVIAELTNVSTETVRRWFRQKKITSEAAAGTYKVSGKKLKEFLFNLPTTINPIKQKYPELFE